MITTALFLSLALPPPAILLHNVALSRDGRYLATSDGIEKASIYEVGTGKLVREIDVSGPVLSVRFVGENLVTATSEAPLTWNPTTGDSLRTGRFPVPATAYDGTPEAQVISSANGIYVRRESDWKRVYEGAVADVAMANDGRTVLAATSTGFVWVDSMKGTVTKRSSNTKGRFVTFSPRGQMGASSTESRLAQVWSWISRAGKLETSAHAAIMLDVIPSALAVSADGSRVVAGGGYGLQVLFPTVRKPGVRMKTTGIVNSVALSPNGSQVFFDQWRDDMGKRWLHEVGVWDLGTGKLSYWK